MVSLSKIVLYVVVLRRDAQLDKFVLECARLLEKAMHLSFYLHAITQSYIPPLAVPLHKEPSKTGFFERLDILFTKGNKA